MARSRLAPSMRVLPDSRCGRWSLGFLALFTLGLVALFGATAVGQTGGDTFTDNWWLAGPGFAAAAGAVAGLATGLLAFFRQRDRSVVVLAALAVGLVTTFFLLGEAISPH